MVRKLAGLTAIITMSVNVAAASFPLPAVTPLPQPITAQQATCCAWIETAAIKRLGGRKRRTPADFVRQFECSHAFSASEICDY